MGWLKKFADVISRRGRTRAEMAMRLKRPMSAMAGAVGFDGALWGRICRRCGWRRDEKDTALFEGFVAAEIVFSAGHEFGGGSQRGRGRRPFPEKGV